MEFVIKSGNPEKQRTACVIVGISETRRLSAAAKAVDDAVRTDVLANWQLHGALRLQRDDCATRTAPLDYRPVHPSQVGLEC